MNEKIKIWKNEFNKIFKVSISGKVIYYRSLSIGEISEVLSYYKTGNNLSAEKIILDCVLYPLDFVPNNEGYLLVQNLVECITRSAKLFEIESIEEVVKLSRDWLKENMENDLFQWKMILIKTFPGYTFENLNNLDPDKFFKLLVLAEEVNGKKLINLTGDKIKSKKIHKDPGPTPVRETRKKDGFLDKREMEEEAANESFDVLREVYTRVKPR